MVERNKAAPRKASAGKKAAPRKASATKKAGGAEAPVQKKAAGAEAPGQKLKWTSERQEIFFRELAELCNVAEAARKAGFEDGDPAYREKDRNPAFRARYEAAVAEGYSRLELEMLERSRFGEDRPKSAGQSSDRLRQVPTALALSLLRLHHARVKGSAPTTRRPMRGAKLKNELEARLSEINRRLGGRG